MVVQVNLGDTEIWLCDQSSTTQMAVASCYDYLLYSDVEGNPVPGLAERWEVSPDSLTYTFHLRRGIQFHDGWGELTAEDVRYNFELGARKGSRNSYMPQWKDTMDKVEVVDPYTITFRFKEFNLQFFAKLGREWMPQFPIGSKKYIESVGIEQAGRKPIGTGPYKFVEHQFGDHIKFEAVENHWRKTPSFKTLIIRKAAEEASRIAMLRAGEADVIELALDSKAEVLKAGFRIKSTPGSIGYIIALGGQVLPTAPTFNPKDPWVGDPRDPKSWDRALKVRKALNLAVNRDEIANTILGGEGQPYAVVGNYPGSSNYNPALKPYPYDPAGAKGLLAEAGYPDGFEITLKLFPLPGRAEQPILGQAVAMMWQKIGIKVKLEPTDWATVRPAIQARKTAGFAWVFGGTFYDQAVVGYTVAAYSKGLANMGAESPDLEKLISQASIERNDEQRAKVERQIAQYLYDNCLHMPLAYANSLWGISGRVGDWPLINGQSLAMNYESMTYGSGFKP